MTEIGPPEGLASRRLLPVRRPGFLSGHAAGPGRELPSGDVTFLFTDIEGSTRLLRALGAHYRETLETHRRVVREAIESCRGCEFGTEGDAFFVAFENAEDAVLAASAAQAGLAAQKWPDGASVRVRMAVHTGRPELAGGNYLGLDVHRVSRICGAGHGGQVLVSRSTRELISERLPVADLGEHRLKDLPEPEWLFQLVIPGLPAEFPPLRSLNNTNLPTFATPLVGRGRELEQVVALICDDSVRLVTLTGPGGSGKTRLAVQAALRTVERYGNGVFFVGLAQLGDPALVLPLVAETVGVREGSAVTAADRLCEHLADKRMLLVLDNFEHLLEAAPGVADLLRRAPLVEVVATSREPLRLSGEHEFGVPPLASVDAVALFVERATAARPGFELGDCRPEVAEICRRLDGLPLAVELAAARVKLLSPRALLARLEQRLDLLVGGARDLPERQRALRATIDWSHELLDAGEQAAFARLGVFAGGFTLNAAETVAGAGLDTVSSLLDKSLLARSGADRELRVSMLETIREYALWQLERRGELAELRRRHAGFFVELAREAESALRGPAQGDWLEQLECEHANLRAALEWAREAREARLELELSASLLRFWLIRGHLAEGRASLERALERAEGQPEELRAKALRAASVLAETQGDLGPARLLAEDSLARYRALGDVLGTVRALSDLGAIASGGGESERARKLFEESMELARRAGDRRGLATAASNLGDLALQLGDHGAAEVRFRESLAVDREVGNAEGVALSLQNLGFTALAAGRGEDAARLLRESLLAYRPLEYGEGIAYCLVGMAALAAAGGEASRAALLLGAADALLARVGAPLRGVELEFRHTAAEATERLLDGEERAACEARGRSLDAEQAATLALDEGVAGDARTRIAGSARDPSEPTARAPGV